VRVQSGEAFGAALAALRARGIRGLYAGLVGPLMTVPLMNAWIFGAYAVAQDGIRQAQGMHGKAPLGIAELAASGAFAGLAGCVLTCPIELVRSKQQLAPGQSIVQVVRATVAADGLRGLNRGMVATMLREVPGWTTQFFVYEGAKRALSLDPTALTPGKLVLAGAVSGPRRALPPQTRGALTPPSRGRRVGMAGWTLTYPQDIIKTSLQTTPDARSRWASVAGDGGFLRCGQACSTAPPPRRADWA
jgi:hypothetical protein